MTDTHDDRTHDHICRCGTRYDCPDAPCTDHSAPYDGVCPRCGAEWDRILGRATA